MKKMKKMKNKQGDRRYEIQELPTQVLRKISAGMNKSELIDTIS